MRAALALPILAVPARAGAAEVGEAGFTILSYREKDLIRITEPVLWARARVGESWEVQGSIALDMVSGASYEGLSNASGRPVQTISAASVKDRRHLADAKVARRFGETTVALSRSFSEEFDYRSHAYGIEVRQDLNERNTTLALGYGQSADRIGSFDDKTLDARRDTREYLLGITQVVSRTAVVQSTVTVSRGEGFYNDPYKFTRTFFPAGPPAFVPDTRPSSRDSFAWFTRYRHHVPPASGTLQAEYRYFRDDWDVRAHTLEVAWQQSLGESWAVRPALRYHTQGAARFYVAEVSRPIPTEASSDPRLAAFGGVSPSVRGILQWGGFSIEATVGHVHNTRVFRAGGNGSPTYPTLKAWFGIFSISRPF